MSSDSEVRGAKQYRRVAVLEFAHREREKNVTERKGICVIDGVRDDGNVGMRRESVRGDVGVVEVLGNAASEYENESPMSAEVCRRALN